jgi:hypothetical protein
MITAADGEWLVPFRGRNHCGTYDLNFLWRYKSIYVMDNHRAAMWCWLQNLDPQRPHSLLHMDWHTDALQSRLDDWLKNCPPKIHSLSIEEYLEWDCPLNHRTGERYPLFRWDNYLSIYLALYGGSIDRFQLLTHGDGDEPNHPAIVGDLWDVPENMAFWLSQSRKPWIVNIDLDYFFWHDEERPGLMVSDGYLQTCFEQLRQKMQDRSVAVTTIALTPDEGITGGWDPSERVAKRVLRTLGIDFELP